MGTVTWVKPALPGLWDSLWSPGSAPCPADNSKYSAVKSHSKATIMQESFFKAQICHHLPMKKNAASSVSDSKMVSLEIKKKTKTVGGEAG